MKKSLKIIGITLVSAIGLILIVATIACYIVFTPSKLTPIVRTQAEKFLTCQTSLDTVNLTFFSTFPNFALEINNLTLTEKTPISESQIAHIPKLSAEVNIIKFLFENSIIINGVELYDINANIFVDSLGNANYNIFNIPDTEEDEDTTSSFIFDMLQISKIDINNLSANYTNELSKIHASVKNFNFNVSGFYEGTNADANIALSIENLLCRINDSTIIDANLDNSQIAAVVEMKDNHIKSNLNIVSSTTFAINGDTLANTLPLNLSIPVEWNNDLSLLKLNAAHLIVDKLIFDMTGSAKIQDDKSIAMDMNIDAKKWDFDNIFAIIPSSYSSILDEFKTLKGNISMNANAKGIYNDSIMPIISATMLLDNVTIHHKSLPEYKLEQTKADMDLLLDLNKQSKSSANIRKLYTKTGTTFLEASGGVDDLMGAVLMNLDLIIDVNLPELYPLVPKDLPVKMTGRTVLNVHLNSRLNDLQNTNLDKIKASGTITYTDLDVLYNDSIHIVDKKGSINLSLPTTVENKQFKPLMSLDIQGTNMLFDMLGSMTANLEKPKLNISVTNPLDTTKMLATSVYFDMDTLNVDMDTLNAVVVKPKGYASFSPSKKNPKTPLFTVAYVSDSLNLNMGSSLYFTSNKIDIKAFSRYDEKQIKPFLKWNPILDVDFNNGYLSMNGFGSDIKIPEIKFNFNPRECKIKNSRIIIDDSDFSLTGDITNIRNYIDKDELLEGKLEFISEKTNIDQLMKLVSGLGTSDSKEISMAENVDVTKAEDNEEVVNFDKTEEAEPFMVPKGVDIVLNTTIKNAIFNNTDLRNILGRITIKDGKVVLEQMGFTAEAAEMQLSGIYRSDRRNHLFAGINFHLLDIDIKSLIALIPDIDSIVPMLSSFEGNGEFHFVAQTYLSADYLPKMSTLRGAAAFEGKNLVVLDNEMFSTISKYLMFNKKTRNVVDSLAVEMTIFRNEIDIYPFAITMGKWQAILAGRHNLDMSFDYHISLTECPLPVRLGLDVKGNFDNMKFDLVPCKYNALYKPNRKKNEMQQRTIELKKLISDSLKEHVK